MCVCVSLCCISPVLAANVIKGCQVTIGSDQSTAAAIEQMGSKHVNKSVTVSFMFHCSSHSMGIATDPTDPALQERKEAIETKEEI